MSEHLEHGDAHAECAMAPKRTWLQRLFPSRALIVDGEREGFAPGYMTVETMLVLDWKDRLRALVSGKLSVTTKTFTSVPVERAESESVVYVLPPNTRVPKPPPTPDEERIEVRPEDVTIHEVPGGPDRWQVLVSDTEEQWEVTLADTPVPGVALRLRNLEGVEETFTVAHIQNRMIVVHRDVPLRDIAGVATDNPRSTVTLDVEIPLGPAGVEQVYPIEFAARDVPQEMPDPSSHPSSYKRDVEATVGSGLVCVRVLGLWKAAAAGADGIGEDRFIADKIEVLGLNHPPLPASLQELLHKPGIPVRED